MKFDGVVDIDLRAELPFGNGTRKENANRAAKEEESHSYPLFHAARSAFRKRVEILLASAMRAFATRFEICIPRATLRAWLGEVEVARAIRLKMP
jgi:hypothetical protein